MAILYFETMAPWFEAETLDMMEGCMARAGLFSTRRQCASAPKPGSRL